jgi:hypothetical protein
MPTFADFFVQNLWFFITGGIIILAGLVGVIFFVRNQGE